MLQPTGAPPQKFQHTAARRRLRNDPYVQSDITRVSTHSRAEAAATHCFLQALFGGVSTHSRAEAAAER